MKKRTFITCVLAGEAAAIVLALVNTYVPGKLIDALVYEDDLKNIFLLISVLVGSFFVCNSLVRFCALKKEIWFTLKRDRNDERMAAGFADSRLDRYEAILAGKRAVLGEFAQRESERKTSEALVTIVSQFCLCGFLIAGMPILPAYIYPVVSVLACVCAASEILYKRLDFNLRESFAAGLEQMYKTIWSMTKTCYAKEIRVYGLEEFTGKKFDEARGRLYQTIDEKNKKGVKIDLLPAIVKGVGIFAAFGFSAFYRQEGATVGGFVICAGLLQRLFESVGSVVRGVVTIADERKYKKEFEGFLGAASGWHEGHKKCDMGADWTIEFRNVSFSYDSQGFHGSQASRNSDGSRGSCRNSSRPAVEGLNLTIRKGERIALVGENGAGKSTFVRLLTGLYRPTGGAIYIDGINLEELDLKDYHKYFSVLYQDFTIFDYSIYENIKMKARSKPSAAVSKTDEERRELDEIAKKLGLYKRIEGTGNGYDTMLSRRFDSGGIELSGGESQKLAFMRALLKQAEILVFDEPTSAMSPGAENEMYSLYGELAEGRTAIYISHRLAGCRLSDRILVFQDGRLVEDGTHDALMKESDGLYRKMFTAQARGYEEAV